jgi:putative DNA primase/helicase
MVPFTETISADEKDPNLRDKLRAEAPGILNWMIEGCLAWQRAGMEEPALVSAATDEYRVESDLLAVFLSEACVMAPHCASSSTQLHNAYLAWCASHGMGERERLSMTAFGRRMGERFTREQRRTGNFYVGVGVRDQHEEGPVEGSQAGFESDVEGSGPVSYNSESLSDHGDQSENPPQPSTPSTEEPDGVHEWEEAVI